MLQCLLNGVFSAISFEAVEDVILRKPASTAGFIQKESRNQNLHAQKKIVPATHYHIDGSDYPCCYLHLGFTCGSI